jgi:hypothetical protein
MRKSQVVVSFGAVPKHTVPAQRQQSPEAATKNALTACNQAWLARGCAS